MFLCVPVFALDGTLRNIFRSLRNVFGHLRILSDPYEIGTLKIKNVTPINVKRLAGILCTCTTLFHFTFLCRRCTTATRKYLFSRLLEDVNTRHATTFFFFSQQPSPRVVASSQGRRRHSASRLLNSVSYLHDAKLSPLIPVRSL